MRLSSGTEKELASFLPVLLGIIFGMILIALIVFIIAKGKQNSGPLKTVCGKVVEKQTGYGAERFIVIQCSDGNRLRLRISEAHHNVCVGDEGSFDYRSETLNQFRPNR